jgi:Tol biopolymer transport system component
MSDRFDVLDRFTPLFEAPQPSFHKFLRRRERKRRNQRIATAVVAIAIFLLPIVLFARLLSSDRTQKPAGSPATTLPAPSDVPNVDYVLDLDTREMSPLPLIRDVGGSALFGQYAASPDGSLLAFVGVKENGSRQIFIAPVGGRTPRQVTDLPTDADPSEPAWSPDGDQIAYVALDRDVRNIFVLDVATGESIQVTRGGPPCPTCPMFPQFTPDGSSIIYTDTYRDRAVARIVSVAGGKGRIFLRPGEGLDGAFAASLSPDGSLVTFLASGSPRPGFHCGPCRFLVNADGTDRRIIPGWESNPAGTWSPDGSRIVCRSPRGDRIIVVDVATGEATPVAEGDQAIWLTNDALLVEVDIAP